MRRPDLEMDDGREQMTAVRCTPHYDCRRQSRASRCRFLKLSSNSDSKDVECGKPFDHATQDPPVQCWVLVN